MDGSTVAVSDFLHGSSIPVATKKQKEFAANLGIEFQANINREVISKLIDAALEKQSNDRQREPAADDGLHDRIREEVLAEMRESGDIPLSKATPEDVANHFENVRDIDMVILFSNNKGFETIIEAQQTENFGLLKGTHLAGLKPDWMDKADLKSLLLMFISNIRD